MVFTTRILDQALCCPASESRDAVADALSRYRRKPAIGYRKLRRHKVVVIQKALVVVAHGAVAGQVGETSGATTARARGGATLGVALRIVNKPIHQNRSA